MKRCVTCNHWHRYTEEFMKEYHGKHAGLCKNEKFVYSEDTDGKTPLDGLCYWDYESYRAGFNTGEQFSCIHWTAREDA